MPDIKDHKRINDILLGPLERPALKWLAGHMPTWMTPDILTGIGLFGAILIASSYALSRVDRNFLWLASLGFIINWFGDSLDGTLARYRHIERPIFGFFLDHVVDAFSEMIIFLGLGLTYYVNFKIASMALIFYLLISLVVLAQTSVTGVFKISYSKLGPTEIRVLAILLNTWMYFGGESNLSLNLGSMGVLQFSVYDVVVGFIALLLLYFFLSTSIQQIKELQHADD